MLNIGSKTNFGVIEDEFKNQFLINGQWIHKSLVKKTDELSKESKIKKLEQEKGKGYITLYHGTDVESYNKIMDTGIFGDGEHIFFFTNNKAEANEYARNKAKYRNKEIGKVICFKIPKYAIVKNEATGEYETGFKLINNNDVWNPEI